MRLNFLFCIGCVLFSYSRALADTDCFQVCRSYVESGLHDVIAIDAGETAETETRDWACSKTLENLKNAVNVSTGAEVLELIEGKTDVATDNAETRFQEFCQRNSKRLSRNATLSIFRRVATNQARKSFDRCMSTCATQDLTDLSGSVRPIADQVEVIVRRRVVAVRDSLRVKDVRLKGMTCKGGNTSEKAAFIALQRVNEVKVFCDWTGPDVQTATIAIETTRGYFGGQVCRPKNLDGAFKVTRFRKEPGWIASDEVCRDTDWTNNNDNKRCNDDCGAPCSRDGKWCATERVIQFSIGPEQRFTGSCPASSLVIGGPSTHWDLLSCQFQDGGSSVRWVAIGNTKPQRFRACWQTERKAEVVRSEEETVSLAAGRLQLIVRPGESLVVQSPITGQFIVGGPVPPSLALESEELAPDGTHVYRFRAATPCDE